MLRFLAPYIAGSVLIAIAGLSGALWLTMGKLDATKADNARLLRSQTVLTQAVEDARLSAAVAYAYRDKERKLATEATAKLAAIDDLDLGECADETIADGLADIIGGVQSAD